MFRRRFNLVWKNGFRAKLAQQLNVQYRMEFDAILRYPNLVVVDVEEAHALHLYQPRRIEAAKMGLWRR